MNNQKTMIDLIEARNIILKHDNIVISSHMDPDPDGIGAELALSVHLKNHGKHVRVINSDPVPPSLAFLDKDNMVLSMQDNDWKEALDSATLLVGVDFTDLRRMGALFGEVVNRELKTITLDHHPFVHTASMVLADYGFVRKDACASGEIIYDLIKLDHRRLPKEALLPIYVSIVGDTGSFRFSNATPKSHRIAAELIEAGVKPRKVYKKLFEAYTIGRMKLLGMVLTDLKVSEDGRIAWMKVTTEMMKTTGCFNGETDGFADIPRSLAGVQISIMFRETGDGGVKLSFRSEPPVDIAPLARSFGGGGHGSAAGAILKGDIDIIESEVLSAAESYLVGKQWEGIPGD